MTARTIAPWLAVAVLLLAVLAAAALADTPDAATRPPQPAEGDAGGMTGGGDS